MLFLFIYVSSFVEFCVIFLLIFYTDEYMIKWTFMVSHCIVSRVGVVLASLYT